MPNTYTQIHIHVVFAVKNRISLIDKSWKNRLYQYIISIIQTMDIKFWPLVVSATTSISYLAIVPLNRYPNSCKRSKEILLLGLMPTSLFVVNFHGKKDSEHFHTAKVKFLPFAII